MHLLIGALAGALFAAGLTLAMSLLSGRKPDWKHVGLAALGGAVAGFVGAATLGAGGMATATLGRQAVAFGLGGAAGGASEQVADNAIEGRPLERGVARATVVGGAAGVVTLGASRATTAAIGRVAPRLAARVAPGTTPDLSKPSLPSLPVRLITAPTPGTGRGWVRSWQDRCEARAARAADAQAPPADEDAPPRTGMTQLLARSAGE